MNTITQEYLLRAQTWMLLTTLVYFLMNGAQVFETAVVIPKWTASPPESFHLLKGKYGLDFKLFWIVVHSIHELTFLGAIVVCWKLEIRNQLLLLFFLHFAVRVWTLAYFAPNIIEFQKVANLASSGTDLLQRAAWWRNLNYIRVGIFVAVSIGLVALYVKLLALKAA